MLSTLSVASSFVALAAAAPLMKRAEVPEFAFNKVNLSETVFGNFNATQGLPATADLSCGANKVETDFTASIKTNSTNITEVCGQTINVTNLDTGAFVLAQIVDECLTCDYGYLALSKTAFENVTKAENFTASYVFTSADAPARYVAPVTAPSSTYKVAKGNGAVETPSAHEAEYTESSSSKTPEWTPSSSSKEAQWTPSSSSKTPEWTPSSSSKTPEYTPEYTPTTSSKQAEYTPQQQKQQSSGGGSYSGQATYFYQGGNPGACGNYNSDSAYIVALDSRMYGGGSHCGQQVRISSGGSTITATVADECPSCASSGSLDLSVAAFQALGSMSSGVLPISWSFA